jgi:hypothetical protein
MKHFGTLATVTRIALVGALVVLPASASYSDGITNYYGAASQKYQDGQNKTTRVTCTVTFVAGSTSTAISTVNADGLLRNAVINKVITSLDYQAAAKRACVSGCASMTAIFSKSSSVVSCARVEPVADDETPIGDEETPVDGGGK